MTKQVIPVRSIGDIQKSDEEGGLKLLVLRTSPLGRKSSSNKLAELLVEQVTGLAKDLELKSIDITRLIIAPGVDDAWPSSYNDPESSRFMPNDETPKVYEALIHCDAVVLVADTYWTFPNRFAVSLCERLISLNTAAADGKHEFTKKVAAVITTSKKGPMPVVAAGLAHVFSTLGFNVPGKCILAAQDGDEDDNKTDGLEGMGDSLVAITNALRSAK